eukprot:TRINITY_DN13315_c0_g1_i1.p1 TRINITY_DN13315_c0_g1~~TRINITY_DN13315_c0_g1_i1.p1  ORF type:complete len:464 (-),score=77.10 TRINITY_DN13315_c0_g1_i1:727-2118(-)
MDALSILSSSPSSVLLERTQIGEIPTAACTSVTPGVFKPNLRGKKSQLNFSASVSSHRGSFLVDSSRAATRDLDGASLRVQASTQVVERPEATSRREMQVVDVDLGTRSYPIYIGQGILDEGDLLRRHVKGNKVLIVTNETIAPIYLERTIAALTGGEKAIRVESVILPDGEQYKNMETLMMIFDKAMDTRQDRKSTFVALGGGVIGDMCGFAAATFVRGVNFIQIPTTMMSQVDSSVGGKTGVNHPKGKNMLGAFYQPECVLIDTETLNTLPDKELASGLAEVIKYGLIRDAEFFEWQEQNMDKLLARDVEATVYAIKRSCENKAEVVAADEKEGGVRATLNLGHTFGHAIENGIGYGEWLHGEAVAAGMVMAADMSFRLGWIEKSLKERAFNLIQRTRLPTEPPPSVGIATFKSLMAVDKKVADGVLRLILLKGPLGKCVFTGEFDATKLEETLQAFCKSE